jgi:hypothetical protein
MITFATLLLGLVSGVFSVAVQVAEPVAAVEFSLDGQVAGRAAGRPWSVPIDFGTELAPHELVARALDADGREIGRARQLVNLPKRRAELSIRLARDESGRAVAAETTWASVDSRKPAALFATLDGRPLAASSEGHFVVPAYETSRTHVISAEALFPEGLSARADVVLGGDNADRAGAELTAVPLRLPKALPAPSAADAAAWLVRRGQPAPALAVESGPAEIVLVRDLLPIELSVPRGEERFGRSLELTMRLKAEDRARFVWPVLRRVTASNGPLDLFRSSRDFVLSTNSFYWMLFRASYASDGMFERRFVDAVALAGLEAAESSRRRAVVLILDQRSEDRSLMAPATVRAFLARLNVPLFVWFTSPRGRGDTAAWGAVEDASTPVKMSAAFVRLRRELESQTIAWVQGECLPREIELSAQALARGDAIAGAEARVPGSDEILPAAVRR